MQLISAEGAKAGFRKVSDSLVADSGWLKGYKTGLIAAAEAIDEMPTIEAEPVKHSYWESFSVAVCSGKKNRDLRVLARNCFRCNRCRHTAEASSNYCPHCGARMDGGAAGGI
jgi:hypothetical protein